MNAFLLILLSVLLSSMGQLLFKAGMDRVGYFKFSLANILPIAWDVATNFYIVSGLALYVISLVVWLMILSRVDVSYAYPMLSIGYIVTLFAAYFLFQEQLSWIRILGVFVIIGGVYLVSKT